MASDRERLNILRQRARLEELRALQGSIETAEPQEQEGFNVTEAVKGAYNLGQNLLTGAIAQPVAGAQGLKNVIQGEGLEGAKTAQEVTERMQTPLNKEGESVARSVSEFMQGLAEVPGIDQIISGAKSFGDMVTKIGERTGGMIVDPLAQAAGIETELLKTGQAVGGSIAKALPEAALEATAAKAALGPVKSAKAVKSIQVKPKENALRVIDILKTQGPVKKEIARLLLEGQADISTAGFKLDDAAPPKSKLFNAIEIGGPRVVKDKLAQETLKQGFDEGVIAAVKGSSKADQSKMLRMVHIMETAKKNPAKAKGARPLDVAGESLLNRFKAVKAANKKAANQLDSEARKLKGKPFDQSKPVDNFIKDLDSIGVRLDKNNNPVFNGSDVEGVAAAERVISQIVKRMRDTKAPDAFDGHRLKKFIDEQVSFGKVAEGLTGRTENILKSLRRNLDQELDKSFPSYDKVNSDFAETKSALDALQDVAGRKTDLFGPNADKAIGTLLKRTMSNAQSRVRLIDAINEIESTAKNKGFKFDDDLMSQVLFADELDAVFKPLARTSFQGQIVQAIPTSKADVIASAAQKAAETVRGINEPAAFKAIKDMLKDSRKGAQ